MLGAAFALLGKSALVGGARALKVGWLGFGLGFALLQFALLGARWWFIARELGVGFSYGAAVTEYTLSVLLNQILPFGVIGDGLRALRHARAIEPSAPAAGLRAKVWLALGADRISGQAVLWACVAAAAPSWFRRVARELTGGVRPDFAWIALSAACAASALWLIRRFQKQLLAWRAELRAAIVVLVSPRTLPIHGALSLLLIVDHGLVFYGAARSLGAAPPLPTLLEVVPLVLAASSVPTFLSGFGVREASTGALYALLALRAADGALIAFLFGTLSLVASLPGLIFLREKNPRNA